MAKRKTKNKDENTPEVLVLTRNDPTEIFELLNYKTNTEKWVLNKGLTKELARSLKRKSNAKIKITTAGKELNAVGVKKEDLDYITEIANKPLFKITTGKEIHILGLAHLNRFDDLISEYKESLELLKKQGMSDYDVHFASKRLYADQMDKMVDLIQPDINHNTNKLNVAVGDIVAFNYNGKPRYNNSLLHLIEKGDRQGAGKVVSLTKNGATIQEIVSLCGTECWDRNTIAFMVKTEKRNISYKRILRKYDSNYIPDKEFFKWEDIKHWSKEDLTS